MPFIIRRSDLYWQRKKMILRFEKFKVLAVQESICTGLQMGCCACRSRGIPSSVPIRWSVYPRSNLSGTILMYMCRSLLIFSNVNFKMAARQPYWNFWFPDSNFSLALNINCKLKWHNTYIYMGRSLLIFSDVTFKMAAWRPYWIFWFPD